MTSVVSTDLTAFGLYSRPRPRFSHTDPGGVTWVNFCWVCAAGLSEPLPHYSLFCGQIIDPILVTFWEMQFSRSQLSHFLFMPLPYRAFYTRFQCYVHRRHIRSSFDMPSFDMLCNLAHIFYDRTRLLVIEDGFT